MSRIYRKVYDFISPGIIPFLLAISLTLLILLDTILNLPSIPEMLVFFKELLIKYGLIVLILASFCEAFFMLNFYLPGSFVIVLSVLVSDKSFPSLAQVALFSWIGFVLANVINFYLGKLGYYKVLLFLGKKNTVENMKSWLSKNKNKAFFLSAIHPNFLAIAIVCAGIARSSFLQTISVSSLYLFFWIAIWLIIATPLLKEVSIEDPNQSWYIVSFFIIWGIINIGREQLKSIKS
jgi:membrane protein DedA with SNARE-associated domain